jgi:hypothetical protein
MKLLLYKAMPVYYRAELWLVQIVRKIKNISL